MSETGLLAKMFPTLAKIWHGYKRVRGVGLFSDNNMVHLKKVKPEEEINQGLIQSYYQSRCVLSGEDSFPPPSSKEGGKIVTMSLLFVTRPDRSLKICLQILVHACLVLACV